MRAAPLFTRCPPVTEQSVSTTDEAPLAPAPDAVNVAPDAYRSIYDQVMKWDETP